MNRRGWGVEVGRYVVLCYALMKGIALGERNVGLNEVLRRLEKGFPLIQGFSLRFGFAIWRFLLGKMESRTLNNYALFDKL